MEIIAFSLVVQNNYQRAKFLNSTNNLTGSIYNSFNNISDYFRLQKSNSLLVEENTQLRNSMQSSFRSPDSSIFYQQDSLFQYINAKVISNTVGKQKNYLMLNKGKVHGIEKDMGVITTSGIVGIVIDVSDNYSRVMSVLHLDNKINARIEKNRHLGSLEWDGKNYRQGILTDIPTHVNLFPGDKIITSGNSHIFPEGIMIGSVNEYNALPNEKFNTARIDFTVDYNNLFYVYVIVNLMKEEQLSLQGKINDE